MALFEGQLKRAIAELKATTRVTMETVGVRFGRRVSTSVYRENLIREPGTYTSIARPRAATTCKACDRAAGWQQRGLHSWIACHTSTWCAIGFLAFPCSLLFCESRVQAQSSCSLRARIA